MYVAKRQLQKGKELGEEIAAGVVNREENSGEKMTPLSPIRIIKEKQEKQKPTKYGRYLDRERTVCFQQTCLGRNST